MVETLDREGTFRLEPKTWSATKYNSGAIGVNVCFAVLSQWFPAEEDTEGQWKDWPDPGVPKYEVWGQFFPVKKNGVLNEKGVESLVRHLGWSGDMTAWSQTGWTPSRCQGDVKEDVYKDVTRYKVQWLHPFNAVPGQGANAMTADELKQLQNQLGGQFRAIAGNVTRDDAAAPVTADASPPTGDNIPF